MKLQQLRYLIAVAENGLNITAAANRLHTSQPGVSKQLRLLEEELGLELFVRNGRSLRKITSTGERILAHARIIMSEVAGIRALARGLINEAEADLAEPSAVPPKSGYSYAHSSEQRRKIRAAGR